MSPSTTVENTVRTTANLIYTRLTESVDSELEADVDAWCDLQGLDRLDNPYEIVARQAAFNTLLKATLYERYSQQGRLPTFPGDPQIAFETAADETDDPAFAEYILDSVAGLVDTAGLAELLSARHDLIAADEPAETIGRLFESLTPQKSRRKLGQFRTPPTIASLMATWLVQDGTETILDPGMGAGALAAAAYQRKQELVDAPPLTDIYGVDRNELALVMAGTSLALLNHGEPHNLQIGDFLDFAEGDVDGDVEAIISNPPYSRHHELDADYKARINSQAEAETETTISALSPMYAYFYYHAAEFLAPGGRLSFITPSEFLETSYGVSLKQFLIETFDIKALVLFDRDERSKFDEAMTTSLVSFLEKPTENDESSDYARLIRVDGDPSETELLAAIDGEVDGETDWGFVNVVSQAELDPADKWTSLFDPLDIDTSDLIALSELATVTRGIATGQNSYYCLTADDVDDWNIDDRYLSKIIRNAQRVPGYDYTVDDWEDDREDGREVWVLYHLTDLDSETVSHLQPAEDGGNQTLAAAGLSHEPESPPGIVDYLRHGRSEDVGAHSGYLAQHRTPWYVVDRRDPPPIVVTYMSRGGSRFIKNETHARTLSNLHGLYLDVDLSETQLKALLAYLNSGFANEVIRRSGRTYSSGMDKIEPNELEGIPVLDPRRLDQKTATGLAERFDQLRQAAREESGSPEAAIEAVDEYLTTIRT